MGTYFLKWENAGGKDKCIVSLSYDRLVRVFNGSFHEN